MVYPPENIVKAIVAETSKECSKLNIEINTDLIEFYVKLTSLNPEYGKFFTKGNKEDIGPFIKHCIDKLSDQKSLTYLMLMLQLIYEKEYDTLDNLIEMNQENIDKRTGPLVNEILQAKPASVEEHEKLLRRISIYLVLKSGLGNPGNILVLREGTAALNSVFSMEDLKTFIEQRNQYKEKQLNELLSIVSGIRIFNKDCGKGGEGIPEMTINLSEAAEATSLALSHCLIRIMERVNLLTTSIDTYIKINIDTKTVEVILPVDVQMKDYETLCKILSIYRQYEILVRKLISDMDTIEVENKELCVNFSTHMYDLHSLVKYRVAIPAEQVFPYFTRLWSYWRKMQNNMFLISAINNVMWKLDNIHEKMEVQNNVVNRLLDGRKVVSDAQRMQKTEELKIDQTFSKCHIISITDRNSDDFTYQYLGFCGLCICVGALIPANPNMGILKWGKRYFAFCTLEHGKTFGFNPNRYIKETLEYIRKNVEMINFLQIYDDIYAVRQMAILSIKNSNLVKTEEKEVQTVLHPIPTNIDKNYIWNIWDYKRKICQMANIVKCRTHSTQTHHSYSKIDSACQTISKSDACIQTINDKMTSM